MTWPVSKASVISFLRAAGDRTVTVAGAVLSVGFLYVVNV